MAREGVLVAPYTRLTDKQLERVHRASLDILRDPGILCFNREAAELFAGKGAEVTETQAQGSICWNVRIPENVITEAVSAAPKAVKLGARNEDNCLILDGSEPRVHFASGSEANNWLQLEAESFVSKDHPGQEMEIPVFRALRGDVAKLATAAQLCEQLDSWDAFLRPVNIQDEDVNDENKDVNKFFTALNNTTKHVMSGLTELNQLDNVLRMAEIIAGGAEKLRENPLVSFITCTVKSPLQLVDDTAQKAMEVARRGMPLVISSSPQGGSTAPIREEGMTAQINAEILTGIAMTQLANPGAPVLYGSVPVRARLDDLNDSYGVPEFSQYNIDCVQMARYYGLPSYSTGGVSDVQAPGVQASVERLFSHILVALSGAQYIHYAFGLLERTNTFCPVQAVLDDTHISMVKRFLAQPEFSPEGFSDCLEQVRRVMASSHKLYTRYVRSAMRTGQIAPSYPFESDGLVDRTLINAGEKMQQLLTANPCHIDKDAGEKIFQQVPGLLPRLREFS